MGEVSERTPVARPRVLLLCSPCMGHLIPFTELARRLVADHGLAATVLFAAATSPPSDQYLALAAAAPAGVNLVALPASPPDLAPPASANPRDRVAHAVRAAVPRVRELARALPPPVAAVVADMVGAPVREVAAELGVPCYLFFTSPWMTLSLLLHLPSLDAARAAAGEEHRDAADPIRLPGCVPVRARDLPPSLLADRASGTYAGFLSIARDVAGFDGILVNTCRELEPAVGDVAVDDNSNSLNLSLPPVHPVGPLVWTRQVITGPEDRAHACLMTWLDQQPRGSVVYVSFGSGGTLTSQQTAELALGLELSRCRFVWAVKAPDQTSTTGAFFGSRRQGEEQQPVLDFLPEGFLERTRELGLVTSTWAPQTAVLAHASVGCFVTHCGWNSVLESVTNGVPMVAWPLYAEQSMNAAMLEEQVRVAVRVKVGGGGEAGDRFVTKEEVAAAIRRAMQGDQAEGMRKRAWELRERSVRAHGDNGCSTLTLAQVANEWKCFAHGK